MIDFSKIEQYRENNRIEAKKALGGLPKSIWETYSAFANTHGGIILLGVEELADKSFRTVDLPDPEKLTKDYVTFPLSELIDIGFYKTPQSARKGFTSGMNILTSLKLRGQIEHSNKSKSIVETLEVLFTGAKIERGQCTIYLNPRINWGFIAQYFTILPLYYFRLSNRASDLLYYIFYLARQNTKQIEEKGYFNIGLRAIQHRLQLPSEVNNTNPYRTIKQPIEECLEELETTHFAFFNNNEFNMLIVADDDAPIKDYLDNGYLKINFTGSFADFFITISKETKFQLKTNERKKARITEKAMIKNLEKKLDN